MNKTMLARILGLVVIAAALVGHASTARAQTSCNPQCAAGQVCVQGTCMVPAPPPQVSPAPAPGYPQYPGPASQAPEGSAYPPPPQSGSYAAPPPGGAYSQPQGNIYAPPQAGYPPPPPASYPVPPPPPDSLAQRRGFLAIPFLGFHTYQGKGGDNLGPGLRLGVLMGGHVSEMISLNGELGIDVLNPQNVQAGTDFTAVDVVIAFSPLVHLSRGNIDFAIGPKLGVRSQATSSTTAGLETTGSASGYVLGLNAGLFGAVSSGVSLGGMFNAEIRSVRQYCSTQPGLSQVCSTDRAATGDSDKVIGLTAAALF